MARKLFWGVEAGFDKKSSAAVGMKYFSESQWLVDRRVSPDVTHSYNKPFHFEN